MLALAAVAGLARAQDNTAADAPMKDDLMTYEVTITNMTQGQPLSPPVLVTHTSAVHLWKKGLTASPSLRMIAEEGMTKDMVKACQGKSTDIAFAPATPEGHIMPGKSMTMKIKAKPGDLLSAVAMIAATNDGFIGLDSCPLDEKGMTAMKAAMTEETSTDARSKDTMPMMKDGMISKEAMAMDAGTEENTEKKSDTPAPDMGKGHVATDPQQPVSMHKGIMGSGDLDKDKMGWTGPVAKFEIKAMK